MASETLFFMQIRTEFELKLKKIILSDDIEIQHKSKELFWKNVKYIYKLINIYYTSYVLVRCLKILGCCECLSTASSRTFYLRYPLCRFEGVHPSKFGYSPQWPPVPAPPQQRRGLKRSGTSIRGPSIEPSRPSSLKSILKWTKPTAKGK